MIPVAHGAAANVFSASVGNVKIGALNENFQEMTTDDGQLVWIQGAEPISLWCGDETDGETLRACLQIYDSLLAYEFGGTKPVAALAESWEANTDATEWTFTLRQGDTVVIPAQTWHAFRVSGSEPLALLGTHVSNRRIVHYEDGTSSFSASPPAALTE